MSIIEDQTGDSWEEAPQRWNQGRCRLKLHSLLLITSMSLVLAACNSAGGDDCVSTTVAAQIEGEGSVPSSTAGCTEGTTPPVTPGEGNVDGGDGDVTESPVSTDDNSAVPTMADLFSANLSFTNFTEADEDKVQAAVDLVKQVVRSGAFRERILNHTYQGQKTFVQNGGKSNQEIYLTLLKGAERLQPEVDHEIDIDLQLYTNNSTNVVGYTYPNVTRVWMNTKYFRNYVPAQVARNLIHEWLHKLGFDHDSGATARRPYSVPYGVGNIIEDLCYDIEDGKLVVP